jgi:thiol-disulfide isomerase/thioredoxin
MNKKIGLGIMLVLIVGAIWYLERIQAHPGAVSGAAPRAINVPVSGNPPNAVVGMGTSTGVSNAASSVSLTAIAAADKAAGYQPAIEIADPTGFVNVSSSFRLADLIGKKVILLDFWTYSCINCVRTFPYLTAWDAKYRDAGLIIVGIHTPEFDFEKDIGNVQAAVQKNGIHYPVVLDSNYGTWHAYGNLYWPHEYLIDLAGYIVHDQIGEGNYDETEQKIQSLLDQRAAVVGINVAKVSTSTVNVAASALTNLASPETYFGSARNEFLANGTAGLNGTQVLVAPQVIELNKLYLSGSWNFSDQFASNNDVGAKIIYRYHANKVFLVASASEGANNVEVLQDGKPVSTGGGGDVHNGVLTVKASGLYNVINNNASCAVGVACPVGSEDHTLELIIDSPGLQAFTFTFG